MIDNKTIIMKYNVDEFGNPISLKIDNENKQVSPTNNIVQLEQTPDELHRVVVLNEDGTQMTEVYNQDEVGLNTFFVDYNRAIVHFHSNQSSKKKIFNYYGKGMELISCERIFDAHDKQGNWVVRTLQDLIDRGRECLELIELLGDAVEVILSLRNDIKIGQELHNTLNNDIEVGTTLQQKLHSDIVEATKWKDQLHTDVQEGKVLQPLLEQTIADGNTAKQQLDQSIADAQDDIAKIEATGNEIIYITSSEWVYSDTSKMYEKQITHTCNSENIYITCKTSDTKEALFLPWKIVDKSNVLLKSDEAIGVNVIISARYYKALIDNTTTQEVIDARKGELTLKDKIDKVDKQLEAANENITKLNEHVDTKVTEINKSIAETNKNISAIAPPNIIYMDSFGDLSDYSVKLQELVNSDNNVEIRFSNKEYIFKKKVNITKKVRLIGSNSSFIWKGTGRFLEYTNAPWMIEGCVIKDIIFKGRGQNVGQDIMVYSEAPNTMMTIENCQFYDCYCHLRFHTQSFGHLVKDCSFWGFTTAINSTGNAEQITLDHCWIDDGVRTDNSQNPCIRVEDATSFWINRCVIQNADIGVSFRGVRNGTIRDCHFENMTHSSVWFYPASQYENRNCVVDCNFLVGGACAIYFLKGKQKNVHNTICNNYIAFLGTSSTHAIKGDQAQACEYTAYYNNSIAPEYTDKPLLGSGVESNKITSFQ